MLSSVFSNVFVYRQRENNTPLENFLIEIFAFCLNNDLKFQNDFFEKVLELHLATETLNISTQENYEGYGRPDIEVTTHDTIILFECKIEATEHKNQLHDYASLLSNIKSFYRNKNIVYLTKYYEHKVLKQNQEVNLYLKRWFSVYELIDNSHSVITQQFKIFLKEEGMENVKNFTIQDMLAMKTIPETISKMDELLSQFKTEFVERFGGYSKESSRSTRLPIRGYLNYSMLSYQRKKYSLLVGFFWWWEEEEIPRVGLSLELNIKRFSNSDILRLLDTELISRKGWECFEDDGYYYYLSTRPLSDFMSDKNDSIPTMKRFIEEQLNTLYKLKQKYPKLLRK